MNRHKHLPPPAFVDEQMSVELRTAMIVAYQQRISAAAPSRSQLAAFIAGLTDTEVLEIARNYPGLRALASHLQDDTQVLHWARSADRHLADLQSRCRALLDKDDRVAAVKLYRAETGIDLKGAMQAAARRFES
jgi:hypothetical protein